MGSIGLGPRLCKLHVAALSEAAEVHLWRRITPNLVLDARNVKMTSSVDEPLKPVVAGPTHSEL